MAKLTRKPKAEAGDLLTEKSTRELDRLAETFINKGGRSITQHEGPPLTRGKLSEKLDPDAKIGITVKLLVRERDEINRLRANRSARDKVSLHDWIIEAVQEKLKKEAIKVK